MKYWFLLPAGWAVLGWLTERVAAWMWPGQPLRKRVKAAVLFPTFICETVVEAIFVLWLWAAGGSPGPLSEAPRTVAELLRRRESELAGRGPRETVEYLWGLYRRRQLYVALPLAVVAAVAISLCLGVGVVAGLLGVAPLAGFCWFLVWKERPQSFVFGLRNERNLARAVLEVLPATLGRQGYVQEGELNGGWSVRYRRRGGRGRRFRYGEAYRPGDVLLGKVAGERRGEVSLLVIAPWTVSDAMLAALVARFEDVLENASGLKPEVQGAS